MTETLDIEGMHCLACEKTIRRTLEKSGITVHSVDFRNGKMVIDRKNIDVGTINTLLSKKGYSLKNRSSVSDRVSASANKQREVKTFLLEKKILANGLLLLCILILSQTLFSILLYPKIVGYDSRYLPALLYLPVAVVLNVVALWHHRAYRGSVSCMTGMMIGMTIGMTSGFMLGALVGLTNGMFIGSVVGTIAGIAAGVYGGKCCGTMGMMEGMMAGLMGGTMGAMMTVMLLADHVLWFIPFLFVICAAILAGLIKIIIDEHEGSTVPVAPWPFHSVVIASLSLMIIFTMIILLLPKGAY